MTFHPRITQKLFVSTVLGSLAIATPVMALDADDFATKFSALSKQNGSKLTFSAIEPDGNTVVSGAADETLRFWKVFGSETSLSKGGKSSFQNASLARAASIR